MTTHPDMDDPTTTLTRDKTVRCLVLARLHSEADDVLRSYGVVGQRNPAGGLYVITTDAEFNTWLGLGWSLATPWCCVSVERVERNLYRRMAGALGPAERIDLALNVKQDGEAWTPGKFWPK